MQDSVLENEIVEEEKTTNCSTKIAASEKPFFTESQNNMTFVRLGASLMVLYGHAFVFMGLPEPLFMGYWPLGPLGVWIFFSISGYLIAHSWQRDPNALRFIIKRSLRIFPALFVCVLLCILLLGPIFTTLPIYEYFKHPATKTYLDNLYLYITYHLPGVFENNRVPNAVNGSLWSLPAECMMYLLVVFMGITRVPRSIYLLFIICFMLLSAMWARVATEALVFYRTDMREVVKCGVFFWVGYAYQRFNIMRYTSVSNLGIVIILWLSLTKWPLAFTYASWLILPFLILSFGMSKNKLLSRLHYHDYSYGMYIYAFPVQQILALKFPNMNIWIHIILAVIFTLLFASLSWHFVEKKCLSLKPVR